MKYNEKKISDLVHFAQKNRNNTLQVLAGKIGVSHNTLQKHNSGIGIPTLEVLCQYATYFKKDINYFFDFEEEELVNMAAEPQAEYKTASDVDYKQQSEMWKSMYDALIDRLVDNQQSSNKNTDSKAS